MRTLKMLTVATGVAILAAVSAVVALAYPGSVPASATASKGVATSAAAVIHVPGDYATIQGAIDAAAPGATVSVAAGTYSEQLVINKDLSLRGAGVSTVIAAPSSLVPFATTGGAPVSAIVLVNHAASVRVSDLAVVGPLPCGFVTGVSAIQNATLVMTDASVLDMHPAAASCPGGAFGTGIRFGFPRNVTIDGVRGTNASGQVSNTQIVGALGVGLRVSGVAASPPSTVTVTDNVITFTPETIPTGQAGVIATGNSVATVSGNSITGGVCNADGCGTDPIYDSQAVGIFLGAPIPGSSARGNSVSGSDIGVVQFSVPNCCVIADNTLTDNRLFGIVIEDGDGETRNNTITGGQIGIGVVADFLDTVGVLRGDRISGTSVAPVKEIDCCGATATAIVK